MGVWTDLPEDVSHHWITYIFREGVDEGIKWLVDAIKQNSIVRPPRVKD